MSDIFNGYGIEVFIDENNFLKIKETLSRIGDEVKEHGISPHDKPTMQYGSSKVFVNGINVCRAGDLATCKDTASGSENVFAGGESVTK